MVANHIPTCVYCPFHAKPGHHSLCAATKERRKITEQIRLGCPHDLHARPAAQRTAEELRRLIELASRPVPGVAVPVGQKDGVSAAWCRLPQVQELYRDRMREAARKIPPFPHGKCRGRGTVMVGLGKYFASAYVSIRMSRRLGDDLPIELWGLPREVLEDWQSKALEGLNVTVRFAGDDFRAASDPGWQLKAYAVLNSSFEEVRFSDADSYPVVDVRQFWEGREYRNYGAIFWRDWLRPLPAWLWEMLGMKPRPSDPQFESGQFFVSKLRHWPALWLSNWINQNSDYYYNLARNELYGDKDTFHVAWRFLGVDYAQPAKKPIRRGPAMIQYDFAGEPAIVHRVNGKFSLRPYAGEYGEFQTTLQLPQQTNAKLPLEFEAAMYLNQLQELAPQSAKAALPVVKTANVQVKVHKAEPIPLAGDLIEKAAKLVGADLLARLWEELTGRSCGCADRKKWLNDKSQELLQRVGLL